MYRFTIVVCLTVLVLFASLALADIPKLINYQGMLTDDAGNPLNATKSITFKIYSDSLSVSPGDKKWEETQTGVEVVNGLFNLMLGRVTALELDFSEDYWLDITVGEEHLPDRIRLTSAGYAYRALVADSALATASGSGSNWSVDNSVLYTNQYWGIARGGAGNALFGDSAYSHVNLGVACTTGTNGESYYYCVVGGGNFNSATDQYTTVGGGYENRATDYAATIAGGYGNLASDYLATVGGGEYDTASADYATVAGGYKNRSTNYGAVVGGGYDNLASGVEATLAGGSYNYATGHGATVSGGTSNEASGKYATVGGGISNTASGVCSFAAGRRAKANHLGTFVWADSSVNADFASTGNNQFLIRAGGGVGVGTNNPSAETRLHVQAISDDFGVLVDAAGTSGTEIGLHTATSQYASLAKNAYFDAGAWQRFNTSKGAYLQEVRPDGEVWFRVVDAGANPISWTNALAIRNSGNVGVGTTNPGQKLDVNGIARIRSWGTTPTYDVQVNNNGDLCRVSSSRRYKKNIRGLESHLDKIVDLKPVSFEWKTTSEQDIGLIAEEVHELIPELVGYDREGRPDAVRYELVSLYLLEAMKELKAENEELKHRIKALEDR